MPDRERIATRRIDEVPKVSRRVPVPVGSIAGIFTIGSSILIVATIAIASTGGAVGIGTIGVSGPGGLALLGAIALGGAGLSAIALVGPVPLNGRASRAGLLLIAIGLLGLATSSLVAMTLTFDPLESWPALILSLAGLLGLAVGTPLTLVGFLVTRGAPRRLAAIFLGGLSLVVLAGNVVLSLLMHGAIRDDARLVYIAGVAVAVVGSASMIAGYAGIGWIALRPGRQRAAAPR